MSFGMASMEGSITPPVSPRQDDFLLDEDRGTPSKRSRLDLEQGGWVLWFRDGGGGDNMSFGMASIECSITPHISLRQGDF